MARIKKAIKQNKILKSFFGLGQNLIINFDPNTRRHKLVGPAFDWKIKRDFQIKFLKQNGLKPNNTFFDLGCGTLRGGIPIIKYLNKNKYFGFDVQKKLLKEGKKEIEKFHLQKKNPKLFNSKSISNLKIQTKFDFIWAFAVLFHMTDIIVDKTIKFASKNLKSNGRFFANVNIGKKITLGRWTKFPVQSRPFSFYQNIAKKYGLKVGDLGQLKDLGNLKTKLQGGQQHMLKFTKNK